MWYSRYNSSPSHVPYCIQSHAYYNLKAATVGVVESSTQRSRWISPAVPSEQSAVANGVSIYWRPFAFHPIYVWTASGPPRDTRVFATIGDHFHSVCHESKSRITLICIESIVRRVRQRTYTFDLLSLRWSLGQSRLVPSRHLAQVEVCWAQ